MGTPSFAVASLEALVEDSKVKVLGVVTQPDRPQGRKRKLTPSPVKIFALEHDLPLYQPENIAEDEALEELVFKKTTDMIITAAYGQKIPAAWLTAPRYGALNVHASLLPRHRGGAPVHYAIWCGDDEAGVTIMQMNETLDGGAIISQEALPITEQTITKELYADLAQVGAQLLIRTLPAWFARELTPKAQEEKQVTYAPVIKKQDEQINWSKEAKAISRKIRAFNDWPGTYTRYQGQRWKIWRAEALPEEKTSAAPGEIIKIAPKTEDFWLACGQGTVLKITEIQPNGKKAMPINSFLQGAGRQMAEGERFDG